MIGVRVVLVVLVVLVVKEDHQKIGKDVLMEESIV